jgi:hypothetical protein
VTLPVAVLLLVFFAALLVGVREAVMFFRWMGHLRRYRSTYASRKR